MKVNELLKQLNSSTIAPVYLVIGDEEFQTQKIRNAFLNLIPHEERQFNVGQYDMEEVSLSTALDDALSVPFFGEKRLVMVNNPFFLTADNKKTKVEHDLNGLIQYINYPQQSSILVIFATYEKLDERKKIVKELKNNAVVIDNQKLSEKDVKLTILKTLENEQFKIEDRALESLLEKTNSNLTLAMKELTKLKIATNQTKLITFNQVQQLVPVSLEQNVFDLVDLVMKHQVSQALQMYHELIQQKEEPLKINAILLGQFRLLLQVKILRNNGYAQGSIASMLKIHPYRIKLAMRKVNQFQLLDLKSAYLGLVDNEQKMKSTNQDPELLFQLFLLKIK